MAEGGRDALAAMHRAAAAGKPFRLVLLDNMMPEMDGFMLAAEIQRHPGLAGSTLMMLTSSDRRDKVARCREVGVTSYLTKPVRRTDLLRAIMSAISGSDTESACTVPSPRREIERLRNEYAAFLRDAAHSDDLRLAKFFDLLTEAELAAPEMALGKWLKHWRWARVGD